jgi:hypothetical protein
MRGTLRGGRKEGKASAWLTHRLDPTMNAKLKAPSWRLYSEPIPDLAFMEGFPVLESFRTVKH